MRTILKIARAKNLSERILYEGELFYVGDVDIFPLLKQWDSWMLT